MEEIKLFKEKLKENKKNNVVNSKLLSRLKEYQVIRKKDVEHKKILEEKLSKAQIEIYELNKSHQSTKEIMIDQYHEKFMLELQKENKELREKIAKISEEYNSYKEQSEGRIGHLIVYINF